MSILKNLKKKKQGFDLKKAHDVIVKINSLIEMKVLQVDLSTRKFSLEAVLWSGKDQTFKSSWCKSIAVYWDATTGQTSEEEVFEVYDLATGAQIAFYSYKNGCYNAYRVVEQGSVKRIEFSER